MIGTLTLDLNAVRGNFKALQEKVGPKCRVSAMVKADAYGCGMPPIAHALYEAGAQDFFVATLEEALAFRSFYPSPATTLYMLNGFQAQDSALYLAQAITPVLNTREEIVAYRALAYRENKVLPAILHYDTGMNRLGLEKRDTLKILENPDLLDGIALEYLMSHLACADESTSPMNDAQRTRFIEFTRYFPKVPRTLANSCGIYLGTPYHMEMVRPGMALYGLNPTPNQANPLSPLLTLSVPLLQVRTAQAGETCGYNATYRFQKETRIGIVALGYADGFFRSLSNVGTLYWNGKACPVLGRVSMDVVIVDLEHGPESLPPVTGDPLEVIGPNQNVESFAASAGTIGYEVLTNLGNRFQKRYIGEEATSRMAGGRSASESGVYASYTEAGRR